MTLYDFLEDQVVQLQTQVQQLITDKQEQQVGQGSQGQSNRSVNLPKLEIPSFNGDALRWSEFWDYFEASVDKNRGLSGIEKLSYLNSKLTGEAKQAVSGILLSNQNYEVAKTILKDRFGKSKTIANSHFTQLMNLKPVTSTTTELRALYDNFERHFRSLEAMQQDTNHDIFVPIISSKIPKDVLLQLTLQRGQTKYGQPMN